MEKSHLELRCVDLACNAENSFSGVGASLSRSDRRSISLLCFIYSDDMKA